MRYFTPAIILFVLCALFLRAASVSAQSASEIGARRGLLQQAQAARTAGDHARALDLAQRAGRIHMSASVRLFIGEEQAALAQLAEAFGTADLCVVEAGREPPSHNRDLVMAGCRALATSLGSRVGRVVIRVPSPAPPGLRVVVAGNQLNEAFFGVDYVVNPGTIVIEATAPDFQPYRREVNVGPAGTSSIEIALTAPAPAPLPSVVITAQPATPAAVTQTSNAATPASDPPAASPPVAVERARVRVLVSAPPGMTVPTDLRVVFDGTQILGDPPQVEQVAPGEHVLDVTATGFRAVRRRIEVQAGQQRNIAVDLEASMATGAIRVNVATAGASVTLDGALLGSAPATAASVPAGEHVLAVSAPGYESVTRSVVVAAGETAAIEIPSLTPNTPATPPAAAAPSSPPPLTIEAAQPVAARDDRTALRTVTPEGRGRTRRVHSGFGTFAIVVGAIGLVGAAVSELAAHSMYTSLQESCATRCPSNSYAQRDTIQTLDLVANIAGIGGGAMLLLGVVVYAASGHDEPMTVGTVRLRPTLGLGSIGLEGRF